MPVQIDTSISSGPLSVYAYKGDESDLIITEGEDEEYTELYGSGHLAKAEGQLSNIYYTSIVPGYLKTSANATLMDITEDEITFTKYNSGNAVSLGVYGVSGEALGSTIAIPQIKLSDEDGPVIKTQPQNVTVSYPDGAEFHVEMEDPETVKSYQWYMLDIENNLFELEGSSAHTDTLVVPSTIRMNNELRFYCVITGKNGSITFSDRATLDKDNQEENKPVFYVGEYAIEPGESIDLAQVDLGDGYKLGSGTVTYDANGKDITISNLNYDNSHTKGGLALAPNVGLDMEYAYEGEIKEKDSEYNITFVGENKIYNSFYDFDYNGSGIPFDFYFVGDGEKPLVNFIGDGTLEITNGYNAVRVIGDLMIDIDITVKQDRKLYADGLVAKNILVAEGRTLNLDVFGAGLMAAGNVFIEGSDITINANAPHISVGTATKNIIQAGVCVNIDNSNVTINNLVEQEVCRSAAGITGISAYADLFITDSNVSYAMDVKEGSGVYTYSFFGITADRAEIENSEVTVEMNSEEIFNGVGISATDYLQFTGSRVNVDVNTSGEVYGIIAETDFNADDSDVTVNVSSSDKYGEFASYGVACENFVVKETSTEKQVKISTADGIAVMCDLNTDAQSEPAQYDENYEAKNFYLREGVECLTPEDSVISLGNIVSDRITVVYFYYTETVYDKNDTSKPASEAVFGLKAKEEEPAEEPAEPTEPQEEPAEPEKPADEPEEKPATRDLPEDDTFKQTGLFPDVKDPAMPCFKPVYWAVDQGIIKGYPNGYFGPEDSCTREQVAIMLWRFAGRNEASADAGFTDVEKTDSSYRAIRLGAETGVMKGYSDGTFKPEDDCQRQHVVIFLYRMNRNMQ